MTEILNKSTKEVFHELNRSYCPLHPSISQKGVLNINFKWRKHAKISASNFGTYPIKSQRKIRKKSPFRHLEGRDFCTLRPPPLLSDITRKFPYFSLIFPRATAKFHRNANRFPGSGKGFSADQSEYKFPWVNYKYFFLFPETLRTYLSYQIGHFCTRPRSVCSVYVDFSGFFTS